MNLKKIPIAPLKFKYIPFRQVLQVLSIACLTLFAFTACSTQKMTVGLITPLLADQQDSFYEETDPEFARQAIPGNLKLLEGLAKTDPDNLTLMLSLAEGFCSYAFSFLQDDEPERASRLYQRGREYAERSLAKNGVPENLSSLQLKDLELALAGIDREQLPGLYWLGSCWAGWVKLNLHDPETFADISKLEKVILKTLELDENFHYAGPHLLMGGFFGGRTKLLGGDPEKAKTHFERNIELTHDKFLITKVIYAQTYAIQTQNRKLYKRLLTEVIESPSDILPEQRLANEVAREKAETLLGDIDDFFEPDE